jgi:hypothetical protein
MLLSLGLLKKLVRKIQLDINTNKKQSPTHGLRACGASKVAGKCNFLYAYRLLPGTQGKTRKHKPLARIQLYILRLTTFGLLVLIKR